MTQHSPEYSHEEISKEWLRFCLGQRASEIMLGLMDTIQEVTEADLANTAADIRSRLPTDGSDLQPHHEGLATTLNDPAKLWYYQQHIQRESQMLEQLRLEGFEV